MHELGNVFTNAFKRFLLSNYWGKTSRLINQAELKRRQGTQISNQNCWFNTIFGAPNRNKCGSVKLV